jgi:hypothetical protein
MAEEPAGDENSSPNPNLGKQIAKTCDQIDDLPFLVERWSVRGQHLEIKYIISTRGTV